MKFCVSWNLLWFLFKKKLALFSTFCKLWSLTCKKRLKKSKNIFCKCVLDFNFAPIKGSVLYSSISKKKSNSLYPTVYVLVIFKQIFLITETMYLTLHCQIFLYSRIWHHLNNKITLRSSVLKSYAQRGVYSIGNIVISTQGLFSCTRGLAYRSLHSLTEMVGGQAFWGLNFQICVDNSMLLHKYGV